MIHEIGKELQVELRANGCPLPVVDGPEPTKTVTWARERIVIEYNDDVGDSFAAPKTQSVNPHTRLIAIVAYKISIYVQSPKVGAKVFEHRRRGNDVRDMVICALSKIARLRKNTVLFVHGDFFTPEDLVGSEAPAGAAYELHFTFDRAIEERTWTGATPEEFTIADGHMTSTTNVRLAGDAEDDTTTACGA